MTIWKFVLKFYLSFQNPAKHLCKQQNRWMHREIKKKVARNILSFTAPSLAAAKALGLETLVKLKENIVAQGIRDELKGEHHNWLIENHGKQTIILLR